jgi:hypothetical protein
MLDELGLDHSQGHRVHLTVWLLPEYGGKRLSAVGGVRDIAWLMLFTWS